MKSVFITGAANGIGLATARKFASEGWKVGLFDIDGEAIANLLDTTEFSNACGTYCDVTDSESLANALSLFSKHCDGKMHVLVNNAGILTGGDFAEMAIKDIEAMIAVNIAGLTRVAHMSFPMLKATDKAVMINTCSASSVYGFPVLAVYSAR